MTNPTSAEIPKLLKYLTFDQLVEHGRQQYKESGRALVGNGMPWAFMFEGLPVSHENDECYIIASQGSPNGLFMRPGNLLLVLSDGSVSVAVCHADQITTGPTPPHTDSSAWTHNIRRGETPSITHIDESSGDVPGQGTVGKLLGNMELMSFGRAMDALMSGQRVGNLAWGGDEPWLTVSCPEPTSISSEKFWSPHNRRYAEQRYGGTAVVLPCITMKTATGAIQMGWVPTQADMFSASWYIVKDRG